MDAGRPIKQRRKMIREAALLPVWLRQRHSGCDHDNDPPQDKVVRHLSMRPPISRIPALISLLVILLLAALLYLYRLDELPPGLWFDGAWSSVAARNSAAQGIYPVYFAANFGGLHPAIVYLARLANALSDDPLSLRYVVAAVSICTVVISFFAYRTIFALQTGDGRSETGDSTITNPRSPASHPQSLPFLAALILTITYPCVNFSRLGLESSFAVLAGNRLLLAKLSLSNRQRQVP